MEKARDWAAMLDRLLSQTDHVPEGYRAVGPVRNEMQNAPRMLGDSMMGVMPSPNVPLQPNATVPGYGLVIDPRTGRTIRRMLGTYEG